MKNTHILKLILGITLPLLILIIIIILVTILVCIYTRKSRSNSVINSIERSKDVELVQQEKEEEEGVEVLKEDLVRFPGGEDLTICDLLEAPGEVIGKSKCGTLYKAALQRSSSVKLLRFLRPVCTNGVEDFEQVVRFLGSVRHVNVVPLLGFYVGPKGEKLLVYPFYRCGNLAEFIRDDGTGESLKWSVVYNISIGIAKGLDHLHSGLHTPLIHGNLKSKNILLDRNHRPYIADAGLYLLLNQSSHQQMLEMSAKEGYKPPELVKMRDANEETDIYSLGIIFLELLTGKEPMNEQAAPDEEPYLPNYVRKALLDNRLSDLYHAEMLVSNRSSGGGEFVAEAHVVKMFQLALACCSPSSPRPNIKEVLRLLAEIGK